MASASCTSTSSLFFRCFAIQRSQASARRFLMRGSVGWTPVYRQFRCVHSSAATSNVFVVADDKSYGGKQVISITPDLYNYILSNVREYPVL